MASVNSALNLVFDILLLEFLGLPPFWEVAVISVLFGLGALYVFKKISNQKGIRAAKDKVVAYLLQVILFKDEPRVVLRAQGRILRYNLAYVGHNLVPMLVLVVPFVVVATNLEPRYHFSPAKVGQSIRLTLELRDRVDVGDVEVGLEVPEGVTVETPPVRTPELRTIDWRLRPERNGIYELRIRVGEDVQAKRLVVGEPVKMLAPKREGTNAFYVFTNPGEPPLPRSSPIRRIEIPYEMNGTIPVLGIDMWWVVVFLLVSVGFGFAIKGALGVEI
jgi:hypothetical protein